MKGLPWWFALAGLVVVLFGPSVTSAFVWDDEPLITYNARLRGDGAWARALTDDFWETSNPLDARRGYWRPVVKLSHVALLAAGGGAAWPFHLLNTALHLACVLLVFRWLRARLADTGLPEADVQLAAVVGAALFAVHGSRYEAVGWASCATDLFMTLFTLLALWALERKRFVAAAALVALALWSKESVVVLPLVLLADGVLRRAFDRRALVAVVVGLVVPLLARAALGLRAPAVEPTALGDAVPRVLAALGLYHLRTLWPLPPTVLPWELQAGTGLARYGAVAVAAGALAIVGWLAWARQARGHERARAFLSDGVWWLLLLTPFLQVVPSSSATFVSDRFLYLPLLGGCALVARALATWPLPAARGVAVLSLGVSAVAVALALPAYDSGLDFFAREYRLHPESAYVGTAFSGELQRAHKPRARRALLVALASQRRDVAASVRAVGLLANATLDATPDDDPTTLAALARFYDALLAGHPVDWELGDERLPLVDPALLIRQVRAGTLDDVELYAATVALAQGRLDDAERAGQRLLTAPTPRRVSLAARVAAARGDFALALARVEQLPALRGGRIHQVLQRAASLAPRGEGADPALTAAWIDVWHDLKLIRQEDAALSALGDGSDVGLRLRLRALLDREHYDEALVLVRTRAPGSALETELENVVVTRQEEKKAELELLSHCRISGDRRCPAAPNTMGRTDRKP